jgi:hypothetical protein
VTIYREYSGEDLDALRGLESSGGTLLVWERLRAELERLRAELEQPRLNGESHAVPFLQGKIAAFRLAIALPEIMRAEITAELKEGVDGD